MILLQAVASSALGNSVPWWETLLKVIGTVAVPLASLYFSWRSNLKTQQLQRDLAQTNLDEKRIEERRKEISRRLEEFYGPLLQYLNKSHELYKVFEKGKPAGFRTLPYLLNRGVVNEGTDNLLNSNDTVILKEILKIGRKIERLVLDKSGLADDPRLTYHYAPADDEKESIPEKNDGLLALLGTHLLIIRYAFENQPDSRLVGQAERYEDRVFPRPITRVLKENIDNLNKELLNLRA